MDDGLVRSGNDMMIIVELHPTRNTPLVPLETAKVSKAYLEKLGYKFRS